MNEIKFTHGNTWTSRFAGPLIDRPVAVDQRIGVLLKEIFSRGVEHPENKVIVLPEEGKAKLTDLTELNTIAVFADARSCELLQNSEWAIKAYMEGNKAFLQETGNWAKYLQTLQTFARQENGILDNYLDSELSKEAIKAILKNQVTDYEKKTLCNLMKRAFASAKTLDKSDLYILDQIPRLDLMKKEYLNGKLPVSLDKIQAAVHDLATKLKPFDVIDPSNPSLFKDLSLWLIDSTAEGNKKEAVNRIISAWVQGSTSLFLADFGLTKIPPQIGQLVNLQELYLYENHLESLPSEIGKLANLRRLSLNSNHLESLPTEIGKLANLRRLDLGNNNLKSLPTEIGKLANLQRLDLGNNNLKSIPTEIGKLANLQGLSLDSNHLESLPTEIGQLTNLQNLDLPYNNLKSIPTEIGQLANLEGLELNDNNLQSLPSEIGQLAKLEMLDLSYNNLKLIPSEIGQLAKLEGLELNNNNLQSLPSEIGQLTNLQELDLSYNNLESLPTSIGQLLSLDNLSIYNNSNLRDLPMSLGNIPGLTDFDIEDTQIPQETVDVILQQCRVMRNQKALQILPLRLAKWQTIAKSKDNLSGIETFSDEQKSTINEWLFRLEKTRDFASAQDRLAKVVCSMLGYVIKNEEFKKLFLMQAEANNEACQDRAAMSLNEIFTSWKILSLPENAPLHAKLKLMTRAAKTLALRSKIGELIAKEEREKFNAQIHALKAKGGKIDRKEIEKACEERESVEIFLHNETALKGRLDLLSAIEDMAYRRIGKRSWIDEDALADYVNAHFFKELYALPIFQQMLMKNAATAREIKKIEAEYQGELRALGNCPVGEATDPAVFDFQHKQGKIMQEQDKEKIEFAKAWYSNKVKG